MCFKCHILNYTNSPTLLWLLTYDTAVQNGCKTHGAKKAVSMLGSGSLYGYQPNLVQI